MTQDNRPSDLHVILIDPDDDTETRIGRLSVEQDCRLAVAAAEFGNDAALQKLVAELNARDRVLVRVPPAAGGGPFRVSTQTYERSRANFLDGLKAYARHDYGIKLVSDAELDAERHAVKVADGRL